MNDYSSYNAVKTLTHFIHELFEKCVNLYKSFDYQDLLKKQSVFFKLFKLPLNIAFEDLENNSG